MLPSFSPALILCNKIENFCNLTTFKIIFGPVFSLHVHLYILHYASGENSDDIIGYIITSFLI